MHKYGHLYNPHTKHTILACPPSSHPLSLFNLLLGASDASTRFWTTDVKIYLLAKFDGYGGSLTDAEWSRNFDLRLQVRRGSVCVCACVCGRMLFYVCVRRFVRGCV